MMRWIVSSSLRGKKAVVAIAAVLFAFGAWQLRAAPVDALPEFSPTTVEVQTEALGLSAEEMEQLITVPLEQDLLNGVAWVDTIRSQSVPGLSSIVMEFEPGTDLYRARQVVQERLKSGTLRLHAWYFDIAEAEVLAYDDREKRFMVIDDAEATRIIGRLKDK